MMDIQQIQYFLAIVEGGSFSAAARNLYISQSSLSKRVIKLENELGVQLFDRSKRRIRLTPAGEIFNQHAQGISALYQSLMVELGEHKSAPRLSIVAIPVLAQYGIISCLAHFKSHHPQFAFCLEEREATSILPSLHNREFDLAILRDNYLDANQYASLKLATDHLQVLVSRKHAYSDRQIISLGELADEDFILFEKGSVVHELVVDACRKAGFDPRIAYTGPRVESILEFVAANSGVALMMENVFEYHKHPDIVPIALEERIASDVVLVWSKKRKLSRPARSFVEFMAKRGVPS